MSNERTTHSNESDRMKWYHGIVVIQESLATDDHRRICKQFGCGRELTQLHSEYCVDHPSKRPDPTKIIKL